MLNSVCITAHLVSENAKEQYRLCSAEFFTQCRRKKKDFSRTNPDFQLLVKANLWLYGCIKVKKWKTNSFSSFSLIIWRYAKVVGWALFIFYKHCFFIIITSTIVRSLVFFFVQNGLFKFIVLIKHTLSCIFINGFMEGKYETIL